MASNALAAAVEENGRASRLEGQIDSGRRTRMVADRIANPVSSRVSYGMASRLLFVSYMLYERVVNSSPRFADLRVNVFGVLERPSEL